MASRHKKPSRSKWRSTKVMNMLDLARDDDFLSHLLVEKLGTGHIPLLVHKMDPSRRLPKTNPLDLMSIIRRLVSAKGSSATAIHDAVDYLLDLPSVRYFTKGFTEREVNSFATHASRYMELYLPTGSIEIAHTQRYSHRTGKSELCILATRTLAPGTVLSELKGSMADLTDAEELELKRTDRRNSQGGIRRDFSVIHSKQLKKNHLFLGPARFVNHDCDNNCELFREGRYITFRVVKPVAIGEEVTAHYGDGYFGRGNRDCLCETCEKRGMGGYGPPIQLSDDGRSDESSDVEPLEQDGEQPVVNVNERRTRRGVYAVLKESDADPAEDPEADSESATIHGGEVPCAIDLALEVEATETEPDATSCGPTSLPPSRSSLVPPVAIGCLATPEPDVASAVLGSALSRHRSLKPGEPSATTSPTPSMARSVTPAFEPIITTRLQKKARELQQQQQLVTPPLSEDTASLAESTSAPPARSARSASRGRGKSTVTVESDRVLRGRPAVRGSSIGAAPASSSASVSASTSKHKAKAVEEGARNKDKGKGKASAQDEADTGKKIKPSDPAVPTCVTCLSVLPIISLDRTIVYGNFDNTTGKGKKEKRECPRCLRHYAIYELPWPHRTSSQLGSMPTPRESTPAETAPRQNTHKLLHAVGKKLAASTARSPAPSPAAKRKRPESPPAAETSKHKRRKTLSSIPRAAAHPRELLRKGWSRSGRKHLPTAKVREIDPTQTPKRPRGRPRLHPLPTSSVYPVPSTPTSASPYSPFTTASAPPALPTDDSSMSSPSSPMRTAKSRAVDDQPREMNGRFGKKASTNGKFRRRIGSTPVLHRTRAQRAEGRAVAQREAAAGASSSTVKRERDSEYDHERSVDMEGETKRARISSGSAHVPKYFTPNPMSFARKKWAPAQPPPPPTHHLRSLGTLPYSDSDARTPRRHASSSAPTSSMSSHLPRWSPPPLMGERDDFEDESDDGDDDDDDDQSADGDWPVTPENVPGPEPETVQQGQDAVGVEESEDNELLPLSSGLTTHHHSLPTLWKPSPNAYAARRWASQDGGGHGHDHNERDQEWWQFFRAIRGAEQSSSFSSVQRRGTTTGGGGIGDAAVGSGISDARGTAGARARGGTAGGGIARIEWMQMNGTARQFRELDTYEVEPVSSSEEEDVVVLKSPDPTRFKLANALFPGMPIQPQSATSGDRGTNSGNRGRSNSAIQVVELAPVEPASSTPSPAPSEGVVAVAPLVLLKGTQFGVAGTTSSLAHATPPGLVEAGWDSEQSAET